MRFSKYHAVRTTVDSITFASKAEARRYVELKMLEEAGEIQSLQLQPKFPLEVNGHKICTYIADFQYGQNGKVIVEDVKGVLTPVFRLKRKLLKALWGIDIRIT